VSSIAKAQTILLERLGQASTLLLSLHPALPTEPLHGISPRSGDLDGRHRRGSASSATPEGSTIRPANPTNEKSAVSGKSP